jgi:indolepyruvate ferredoxin oxidoreductase
VHLAPPLWSEKKQAYGGWVIKAFGLLAHFKFLRGTRFDPFGATPERRAERQLIADYEALIADLTANLTPANHAAAVALANLPETIRGFGPVKEKSIAAARQTQAELLAAFRDPVAENRAAQ